MTLKFNVSEVLKALTAISPAIAKKVNPPILENIKVKVKDNGTMVLVANDLEVYIAKIVKNVESDGVKEFCINPKDLSRFLSSLNKADERVVCDVEDTNIVIHHSRGEISIPTLSAEDYSEMKMDDDAKAIRLDGTSLIPWLNVGLDFVANDELRPVLCSVYLSRSEGVMRFASTDAHKLISSSMASDGDDFEAFFTQKVVRLLGMNLTDDTTTLRVGKTGRYSIRTSDTLVIWLAPLGKYPNFSPLIAKRSGDTVIKLSRNELRESIVRTLVSTDEVTTKIILKTNDEGEVLLMGEDLGKGKKSLDKVSPIETNGGNFEIAVKGSFFLDAVDALDDGNVLLMIKDSRSSIMLTNEEDNGKVVIVMPLVI